MKKKKKKSRKDRQAAQKKHHLDNANISTHTSVGVFHKHILPPSDNLRVRRLFAPSLGKGGEGGVSPRGYRKYSPPPLSHPISPL